MSFLLNPFVFSSAVVGVNGTVLDFQPDGSLSNSFATIGFNSNGSVFTATSEITGEAEVEGWYIPNTSNIWAGYWVRATSVLGAGPGRIGTLNTWIQMSTNPQWTVFVPSDLQGVTRDWELTFEFSLSNGGPVVSIPSSVYLSASVGGTIGGGGGGGLPD